MEFTFDSDGLLTSRSDDLESIIYSAHKNLFDGACEINRSCHKLLFSAEVNNASDQKIVVVALFLRALEHYQAIIILLGRGVISSSKVSLRACMEAVFKLRSVVKDEAMINRLVDDDRRHLKKAINRATNSRVIHRRKKLDFSTSSEGISEIDQSEDRSFSIEEWSKLADLHKMYVASYPLLSLAAHTQIRDLEQYLKLGPAGRIQGFRYAPALDKLPLLLLTSADCLLSGALAFDEMFKSGFQQESDRHRRFVRAGLEALEKEEIARWPGS